MCPWISVCTTTVHVSGMLPQDIDRVSLGPPVKAKHLPEPAGSCAVIVADHSSTQGMSRDGQAHENIGAGVAGMRAILGQRTTVTGGWRQ
eukprot:3957993-Amphidinium_carterae.1